MESDKNLINISLSVPTQGTNNIMERLSKVKQLVRFLGPAFVVSVAYIDPG